MNECWFRWQGRKVLSANEESLALEFRLGETTTNAALPLPLSLPSFAQVGSKEGSGGSAGWVSKQDTWAPWECPVEGRITPELEEGIQSSLTYYVYSLTYHKQSFCIELKGED